MVTVNRTSNIIEDVKFELSNMKGLLLQAKLRLIKAKVQKISRLDGISNCFKKVINQGS